MPHLLKICYIVKLLTCTGPDLNIIAYIISIIMSNQTPLPFVLENHLKKCKDYADSNDINFCPLSSVEERVGVRWCF